MNTNHQMLISIQFKDSHTQILINLYFSTAGWVQMWQDPNSACHSYPRLFTSLDPGSLQLWLQVSSLSFVSLSLHRLRRKFSSSLDKLFFQPSTAAVRLWPVQLSFGAWLHPCHPRGWYCSEYNSIVFHLIIVCCMRGREGITTVQEF